ncbi:hypothetical protein HGRIS_004157 [Hohenbuehelia grisea]|uniref:Uncharacterized protein n=1 Tax=Hohenbuehelia grisea TaxID=104357 RepID=A0ABR3JIC5_9AGAR
MSTATTVDRHVQPRRGSVSAPDAYGKHAVINMDPNRSSSSRLTIVKVPAPPPGFTLQDAPPSSPGLSTRRGPHRRHGHSNAPADSDQPQARLSFAFSSFGPTSPGPGGNSGANDGRSSPTSSPRLRPSSPTQFHSARHALKDKPRLTPDQLVDLARQSTNPKLVPPLSSPAYPRAQSPAVARASSPVTSFSPLPPSATAPATFTPLPDEIYLPFIDRPAEVSTLIANAPTAKLLALLAQTFPKKLPTQIIEPTDSNPHGLPKDPTTWTYAHLTTWLGRATRTEAPDPLWVLLARKCVLSHSELIWERLKGALGVPPELDIDLDLDELPESDDEHDVPEDVLEMARRRRESRRAKAIESGDESALDEDEGRKAYGHWDDWDAVMDSPVSTRRRSISQSHSGAEDEFMPPITPSVSIEPLLLPDPALEPSTPTPLTSAGANDGLGDISEAAEGDEEAAENGEDVPAAEVHVQPAEPHDPDLISPGQITGIRISTAPVPQDPNGSPLLSAVSPLPPWVPLPGSAPSSPQPPARSSSFSSLQSFHGSASGGGPGSVGGAGVQRSSSSSSLYRMSRGRAGTGVYGRRLSSSSSASGRGFSLASSRGYDSDDAYDPVGGRMPGHPLFPSNFARLTIGPTLSANNPALRGHGFPTRHGPPQPKPRSRPPSRSSTYSYTDPTPAPAEEPPAPARRASGIINSGAAVSLGIMPGGVVKSRGFGR